MLPRWLCLPLARFGCCLIYSLLLPGSSQLPVKGSLLSQLLRLVLFVCDLCPWYRCPVLPGMPHASHGCCLTPHMELSVRARHHHTTRILLHARRLLLVAAAAAAAAAAFPIQSTVGGGISRIGYSISSSNQRTHFVTILFGFGDHDWSTSRFSRPPHCKTASTCKSKHG